MYDDDRITLDLEPDQLPAGAGGYAVGEGGVVVHRTETAYVECDRRGVTTVKRGSVPHDEAGWDTHEYSDPGSSLYISWEDDCEDSYRFDRVTGCRLEAVDS